ncbi:MAG: AraC family transcriptional regulator [Gemmatimonadetes bacterium]|nr:MAG: AraC family transcriptional regulator [Gemmatimonadota bacterium]
MSVPHPAGSEKESDVDVIGDVLRTVRLRGTVYFQAEFRAPWGMDINGGEVANFHLVVEGRCWVSPTDGGDGFWLERGDLVVFPHGDAHRLAHDPAATPVPAERVLRELRSCGAECPAYGGTGPPTRLVCGHFERAAASRHRLLDTLPPVILLRREECARDDWLHAAAQLAAAEASEQGAGASVVVDRLAEALFVQVLRAHLSRETARTAGFGAALGDAGLVRVLQAMHEDPLRDWSLAELARRGAMSRSTLASRFRHAVGTTPMRYLTEWRLERARDALAHSGCTLAQAARLAGYANEFSFARAFKRVYGATPGSLRRAEAGGRFRAG